MELEQLLTLIQTVSDSKLTEFKYETETLCVKMGKESSVKVVTADPLKKVVWQQFRRLPRQWKLRIQKRRKHRRERLWHPLL